MYLLIACTSHQEVSLLWAGSATLMAEFGCLAQCLAHASVQYSSVDGTNKSEGTGQTPAHKSLERSRASQRPGFWTLLHAYSSFFFLPGSDFVFPVGRIQVCASVRMCGVAFVILVCSTQAKKAGPRGGR